jgi:hypothetical protein
MVGDGEYLRLNAHRAISTFLKKTIYRSTP